MNSCFQREHIILDIVLATHHYLPPKYFKHNLRSELSGKRSSFRHDDSFPESYPFLALVSSYRSPLQGLIMQVSQKEWYVPRRQRLWAAGSMSRQCNE